MSLRTGGLPLILGLDVSGTPFQWLHWQDATSLYVRGDIAWSFGETLTRVRGGVNRRTGQRSVVELNSIVSLKGAHARWNLSAVPCLTNRALFRRDRHRCMYCGKQFPDSLLTRDHVLPKSRGGKDIWTNVVAACVLCNSRKGSLTPDEAGMRLLAIPFTPNRAEYLILANRKILADQMGFLNKFSSRVQIKR